MRKTKNNYVPAEYGGYLFPKSCLPEILPGDRGKVLTVNNTETEAEWEQASGGGGMVVYVSNPVYSGVTLSGGTLDHTWNQINSALRNGIPVLIVAISDGVISPDAASLKVIYVQEAYGPMPGYYIEASGSASYYSFGCETGDGYPELNIS